jgi:signal transduction histidine kinase
MSNRTVRFTSGSTPIYSTSSQREDSRLRRLAFLGTLSAGLAHDYANAFHAILLKLACLKKKGELRPTDLDSIERQFAHAAQRAEQLNKFINGADASNRFSSIDLRTTVEDAIELIGWRQSQIEKDRDKYTIEREFADLPPIVGPVGELMYLFVNLLMNACEAMPDGGAINVSGRAEDREAIVTIADQGSGIPYDLLAKMFDEFVTTKKSGSGWGLFMARELMHRLGGSIAAENSPSGGALFTLRFPLSARGLRQSMRPPILP